MGGWSVPEYERVVIERPAATARGQKLLKGRGVVAYFDGGCQRNLGTGGFVVYGPEKE